MSYFSSFAQNKDDIAACLLFFPRWRPENQSNENVVMYSVSLLKIESDRGTQDEVFEYFIHVDVLLFGVSHRDFSVAHLELRTIT